MNKKINFKDNKTTLHKKKKSKSLNSKNCNNYNNNKDY